MSAVLEPFRELVRRRLWPVAVLLLVAAVAAPKLLADPAPPVAAGAGAATEDDGPFSAKAITTVASADGTERRRVLGARKDPFRPTGEQPRKQAAAKAPSAKTAGANAGAGAGSSPESSSPTVTSGGGLDDVAVPGLVPTIGSDTTGGTSTPKTTPPAYSLRVTFDEKTQTLERLDPLPDAEKPLVIYLGLLKDGKTAVFLLDASVSTEGDGSCHPSPRDCQRLYLKKGETAFFEVAGGEGAQGEQHQLDVLSIRAGHSASSAKAGTARATASAAARRALRTRMSRVGRLRFDARTGRLHELSVAQWRRSQAGTASR